MPAEDTPNFWAVWLSNEILLGFLGFKGIATSGPGSPKIDSVLMNPTLAKVVISEILTPKARPPPSTSGTQLGIVTLILFNPRINQLISLKNLTFSYKSLVVSSLQITPSFKSSSSIITLSPSSSSSFSCAALRSCVVFK